MTKMLTLRFLSLVTQSQVGRCDREDSRNKIASHYQSRGPALRQMVPAVW